MRTPEVPFARRRAALAGTLLVAAVAVPLVAGSALCGTAGCASPPLDRAILAAARANWGSGINEALMLLTWAGSLYVLAPLAMLDAAWRWRRWPAWSAAFVALALGVAALLSLTLKHLFERPRPPVEMLVPAPADPSFPSGHAMHVTAFALAWLLAPGRRPSGWAWALAVLAVIVVGWSRLHLQVHFPSDVLAGTVAAALLVAALATWFNRGAAR